MEIAFVVSNKNQNRIVLIQVRSVLKNIWKWISAALKGVFAALFIPSLVDQQIEENRERVRQLMARSY